MLQGRFNGANLRITFRVDQARMAIACRASDAGAAVPVFLVEHHAQGYVKRLASRELEILVKLLNSRLVTDGRMRIRRTGIGFCRIFASISVDVVQVLG